MPPDKSKVQPPPPKKKNGGTVKPTYKKDFKK